MKTNRIYYQLLTIIILISTYSFSQVEFNGIVKDKETGTELENVLVVVKPLRINKAGYYSGVYTKKNGLFSVKTSYDLPLQLNLTKKGCKSKKIKFKKTTNYLEIVLECENEIIEKIIIDRNSDNDKDGIENFKDDCIDTFGSIDNSGCPWPDNDNDGTPDKDDMCPDQTGEIDNKGCPWNDSDEDGVLDKDDICINEKGTIENKGCPDKVNDIIQLLSKEQQLIYFTKNSFELSNIGLSIIKNLSINMKKFSKSIILIEGHCSSEGSNVYNQNLSEKRAEEVKKQLTEIGIEANRIKTKGYGETKPLNSNDNEDGRKMNRRIKFVLVK
tara:strand:- start:430 stop:1416 length:987 start_codon:yes stop_codon:yes gene_type:complete